MIKLCINIVTNARYFILERIILFIVFILVISLISCDRSEIKVSENVCEEHFIKPCEFVCGHPYSDTTKWVIICRVWGLLKYYHPNVTSGKLDWDKILLDRLGSISNANTPEKVNIEIKRMLDEAGKYKYKRNADFSDSLKMNVNLCWLDNSYLDNTLQVELRRIASLPVEQPSYYNIRYDQVFLQNEKDYKFEVTTSSDSMRFRLLSLFRYWNVIYYFFPHKYLMDHSWDKILTESIFSFIEATDDQSYQIALLKLASALNDGHAYISMVGQRLPENLDIIETVDGKTVVKLDVGGLQKGDIIKNVGILDIQCIRDSLSGLISASTQLNKDYRINGFIAEMISYPEARITVLRGGKEIRLHLAPFMSTKELPVPYKWISDEIGYVDFSTLAKERIDSVFHIFTDAKGIIFDLRNGIDHGYDADYFSLHLNISGDTYRFTPIVIPDLIHPGAFCWRETSTPNPNNSKKEIYKGEIVYLINERSQSAMETIAWEGRTNFNATLIGRPTSGALGRVTWIPLPGSSRTRAAFSNFALFSLDGSELQRKGVIPDIEVYPTMESIKTGKDEILEAAKKYLISY